MRRIALLLALVMGLAAFFVVPAASARHGNDVRKSGSCSDNSNWKLKLSKDNGRIDTEFEVDQNRVGQDWRVHLKHDGNTFFSGTRTTHGPSGSFTVQKRVDNSAGADHVSARAVNVNSNEVCTA